MSLLEKCGPTTTRRMTFGARGSFWGKQGTPFGVICRSEAVQPQTQPGEEEGRQRCETDGQHGDGKIRLHPPHAPLKRWVGATGSVACGGHFPKHIKYDFGDFMGKTSSEQQIHQIRRCGCSVGIGDRGAVLESVLGPSPPPGRGAAPDPLTHCPPRGGVFRVHKKPDPQGTAITPRKKMSRHAAHPPATRHPTGGRERRGARPSLPWLRRTEGTPTPWPWGASPYHM